MTRKFVCATDSGTFKLISSYRGRGKQSISFLTAAYDGQIALYRSSNSVSSTAPCCPTLKGCICKNTPSACKRTAPTPWCETEDRCGTRHLLFWHRDDCVPEETAGEDNYYWDINLVVHSKLGNVRAQGGVRQFNGQVKECADFIKSIEASTKIFKNDSLKIQQDAGSVVLSFDLKLAGDHHVRLKFDKVGSAPSDLIH